MENFRTEFRDALLTDTGGVLARKGDKILYNAGLPAEQVKEGHSFPVWIKAIIREVRNDQVLLDNVEVLRGFNSKVKIDLVIEHSNDISNRFRGNKPLRLTRNEKWFIFPQGKKSGVTDFIKQHGHEALAAAVGFPQDDRRVIQPEEDPEMQLVDKQSLQNAFRAAEIEDQTQDNAMVIIDEAMFDPHERALTITGIMNQFDAETPFDKDISDVIYAVNVLSSIIGYTIEGAPRITVLFEAWKELLV